MLVKTGEIKNAFSNFNFFCDLTEKDEAVSDRVSRMSHL